MKVVIIHGIADDKNDKNYCPYWMSWIKEKLKEKEIKCFVPLMPNAWNPIYEFWKEEFEQIEINE